MASGNIPCGRALVGLFANEEFITLLQDIKDTPDNLWFMQGKFVLCHLS